MFLKSMLNNREGNMSDAANLNQNTASGGKIVVDLFYLPPIEFFVAIDGVEEIVIEKHDNYQKQSYRNRTAIQLANQVKHLSIPVAGGNKKRKYVEVEMDDSQCWRNVHLRGIQSAYGKAPFFEYFFSDFEAIYLKDHTTLYSFNLDLLTFCLRCLRHTAKLVETSSYEAISEEIDLRGVIKAKQSYEYRNIYKPFPYAQIFGLNFAPNLSILDLLFCSGPNSKDVIDRSKKELNNNTKDCVFKTNSVTLVNN